MRLDGPARRDVTLQGCMIPATWARDRRDTRTLVSADLRPIMCFSRAPIRGRRSGRVFRVAPCPKDLPVVSAGAEISR